MWCKHFKKQLTWGCEKEVNVDLYKSSKKIKNYLYIFNSQMATCCKHCMAILEIPFCQFFTDLVQEPARTKHEFWKVI